MQVRELSVPGAWEFTPKSFGDDRGLFLEWFKAEELATAIGHPFQLVQANHSVSARGVLRGIHFAAVPPSQAKYVYCPQGAAARRDRRHPGRLAHVRAVGRRAPRLGRSPGRLRQRRPRPRLHRARGRHLGHLPLLDRLQPVGRVRHQPARPGASGCPGPTTSTPILSPKDRDAPTLAEAEAAGLLPRYDDCLAFYESLRG